ncbi:MAG: cytochrome c3 family protein [Thermodesulfobacteriota bacterium]
MAALEENGCGVCHHSRDDASSQLVYIEGEELSCRECHLGKKKDGIPALREAYHGSCTACHRKRIKTKQLPSGPTTCGECHKAARP